MNLWQLLGTGTDQSNNSGPYPTYPNSYNIGSGSVGTQSSQQGGPAIPSLGGTSASNASPSIGGLPGQTQSLVAPTSSLNPWSLQGDANAR